jgi:hypothetical protein
MVEGSTLTQADLNRPSDTAARRPLLLRADYRKRETGGAISIKLAARRGFLSGMDLFAIFVT